MFPIDNLPPWISFVIGINPLTYGVDLLRWNILGIKIFALYIDFLFLTIFAFIMLSIGVFEFTRRN